jgi:hypothetical protein
MLGVAILGAGPAGTGPLVWAAQRGKLRAWLNRGITVIEETGRIGGSIGDYLLNADSLGTSFIECLNGAADGGVFAEVRQQAATRRLEAMRAMYPPLDAVGDFIGCLGAALQSAICRHPGGSFIAHARVRALRLQSGGTVAIRLSSNETLTARTVVMALGGRQYPERLAGTELLPGMRIPEVDPSRVLPCDLLFRPAGAARARDMLRRAKKPRAVILGGSHSAFSAAWVLLNKVRAPFGAAGIIILHRRPPRIFYPTREAALADGYPVGDDDICPFTRRVHRLGGLRNDGRELWRRLTARPGTEPEHRVKLVQLSEAAQAPWLRDVLDEAALVVPALGYRLNTVPILDSDGRRIPLAAEHAQCAVAGDSRLLRADGRSFENIFAIGLGSGYRPWGRLAGEPSFDGQQNSLWLYQNGLGEAIYSGIEALLDRPLSVPPPMPSIAAG